MSDDVKQELLDLSQRLLDAIDGQDWDAYAALCDPSLTAFEPEGEGHRVVGMEFHRFYFAMQSTARAQQSTISNPHVRVLGNDAALVTYVRLMQRVEKESGRATTTAFEETRLWQRQNGAWKHVHFHRS